MRTLALIIMCDWLLLNILIYFDWNFIDIIISSFS